MEFCCSSTQVGKEEHIDDIKFFEICTEMPETTRIEKYVHSSSLSFNDNKILLHSTMLEQKQPDSLKQECKFIGC